MRLIDRDELKAKLDRGDDFKLVMSLNEFAFNAMHIPGSLNITAPEQARDLLGKDDEIVVYCSNPDCMASIFAYAFLKDRGFKNIQRYAGGVLDWQQAGYPLEGTRAPNPEPAAPAGRNAEGA